MVVEEGKLAARCADGEEAAWEELIRKYRMYLIRAVVHRLHGPVADFELAEEIVDRTWCSLTFDHGAQLRKFDPTRERLPRFLAMRAHWQLTSWVRQRRRRRTHEQHMAIRCDASQIDLNWLLDVHDLMTRLTAKEANVVWALVFGSTTGIPAAGLTPLALRKIFRRIGGTVWPFEKF